MKLKAQTLFAFMFYATLCYIMIVGKEIPQALLVIVATINGFYYGNKTVKKRTTGDKGLKNTV